MAKVTTRLRQGGDRRQDHADTGHSAEAEATAGVSKLMNLNLSTYVRVRFGGLREDPLRIDAPHVDGLPRCRHRIERDALIRRRSGSLSGHPG